MSSLAASGVTSQAMTTGPTKAFKIDDMNNSTGLQGYISG